MKKTEMITYVPPFPEHIQKWIKNNRLERSYEFEEYHRNKQKNKHILKKRKEMYERLKTFEAMEHQDELAEILDRKDDEFDWFDQDADFIKANLGWD